MPVVITKNQAPKQAVITKEMSDGSVTEKTEVLGWVATEGPPANVNVSMGMTKKTADYENVKFLVSLTIPSKPDEDSLEAAFQYGKSWVEQRVDLIFNELNEMLQ